MLVEARERERERERDEDKDTKILELLGLFGVSMQY